MDKGNIPSPIHHEFASERRGMPNEGRITKPCSPGPDVLRPGGRWLTCLPSAMCGNRFSRTANSRTRDEVRLAIRG
jgi:hypothetical protein